MAMSFANTSGVPGANAQVLSGAELQEITVESLGFKTLAGEIKIKLLPTPWPLTNLPSSTSSLLSISSKHGLLAAAGPDALVLARTIDIRKAFTGPGQEVGENTKDFKPAQVLEVPKLSQVAFTSDGTYLVICAEGGGGLQVYETQSLLQDKKDPYCAIPTNGISVRALAPNPWPDTAHLVAVVLTDGKLLIANLKTQNFMTSANGAPALKEGVASVSWSNRGKQLTAGMVNGHAFQLDQSGTEKASIPAPPGLASPHHISSLLWLSNDAWLMYHTPNSPEEPDRPPESILHYVETDKERSKFQYRKFMNDPVAPFGQNRVPLTHYMCRLRNWFKLKDWLMLSSVVSSDVGMITNSESPLTSDNPIVNEYTVTSFANDSSRISLPMSYIDQMQDTTAIGMSLDLSATEKVAQPIPGDEMDESPFPLPCLMLLSNEGTLSASWVIYNDALRNNQPCPDVIATAAPGSGTPAQLPFGGVVAKTPAAPAFGSGGFSKPAAPAFGQSTFGTPSAATPAFGGASQIGARPSVWGSGSTTKPPGTAFGEPGAMGAAKPVFGSAGALGVSKPVFGSSAFGASTGSSSPFAATANDSSKAAASPFGALAGNGAKAASSSPFSAFSGGVSSSPFSTLGATQSAFGQQSSTGPPAFATSNTTGSTPAASFGMSSQPSFGSTVSIDTSAGGGSTVGGKSVFNTPANTNTAFGKPPSLTPAETQESEMMDDDDEKPFTQKEDKPSGPFGLPSGGFKLGTTFKPGNQEDKSDEESEKEKEKPRPKGLFGADFGAALGDSKGKTTSTPIKKEPTDDKPSLFSIPAANKNEKVASSLFGSGASSSTSKPTFTFGKPSPTPVREPAPPEVTSRLEPSPSTTTAPSSESKASSKGSKGSDDSQPLAGSEAEAIEMPDSDDEESDEESDIVDDAPLPPDPSTIKVSKGFYDNFPNPGAQSEAQPRTQSKAPSDAPMPPDPSTIKVSKGFYSDLPGVGAQTKTQPPPKLESPPTPKPQEMSKESPPLFSSSKPSTTPSGFPKAPQMFAPPMPSIRGSPRSPSPVRSASTPLGKPPGTPLARPPSVRPSFTPSVAPPPPKPQPKPEQRFKPTDLQDKQAEHNRAILESPLNPTLQLANFMAHQDYVGPSTTGSISGQIERLYRDINAMIDTLGLNARSLAEFVSGHNSLMPEKGRSKEDLDDDDEGEEWCLVEIEDLMGIERSLEEEIENERIEDKEDKIAELHSMRKELVRTKNKLKEVRKFLGQAKDKEALEKKRNAPLDKATEARQKEIRRDMAGFLKILVEAEEAVSMLKVKLAGSGKANTGQVPTVETVENTVRKMTQWAEKKGADMDVLEAQMMKLGLVASGNMRASTASSSSSFRRSGVFSTPSPKKSGGRNGTPRSNGKGKSFGVPEEDEESGEEGFESVDVDREAVREFVEIRKKKAGVLGRVRDAIRKRGVRVNEG